MCCLFSPNKFKLTLYIFIIFCNLTTLIHSVDATSTRFRLRIVSNEERSTDTENDYHIENESSKTYIDSDSDFSSAASIFRSRQKASETPAAQTTQFIMVPGLNGQFVSPAQVQQQSAPIVQPIVIQAPAQPTAPPSLRLPQVSLNLVSPGRTVNLGLGGLNAPVIANPGLAGLNAGLAINPFIGAGFGGGGGGRVRGRGRGRGRGRRRRPGAARVRQAAMLSALRMAQLQQQQQQPQMQVLQPIILQQPPASSTSAPIREVEQVRQVVQPVVQPIVAQPIVQPISMPIESTTSLRQQLSHIAEPPPPSYHRVVPSPYSRSPYSSSYYGYTANRSYYRTPSGGIVNQIVIQPPANQGKGLLSKTRKKMRQKMAKKLIKMLDE